MTKIETSKLQDLLNDLKTSLLMEIALPSMDKKLRRKLLCDVERCEETEAWLKTISTDIETESEQFFIVGGVATKGENVTEHFICAIDLFGVENVYALGLKGQSGKPLVSKEEWQGFPQYKILNGYRVVTHIPTIRKISILKMIAKKLKVSFSDTGGGK